tara:strand:+ start:33605 stop:34348 length:744 start_codon:yes stop_codon:yes gene_type:complete
MVSIRTHKPCWANCDNPERAILQYPIFAAAYLECFKPRIAEDTALLPQVYPIIHSLVTMDLAIYQDQNNYVDIFLDVADVMMRCLSAYQPPISQYQKPLAYFLQIAQRLLLHPRVEANPELVIAINNDIFMVTPMVGGNLPSQLPLRILPSQPIEIPTEADEPPSYSSLFNGAPPSYSTVASPLPPYTTRTTTYHTPLPYQPHAQPHRPPGLLGEHEPTHMSQTEILRQMGRLPTRPDPTRRTCTIS